MINSPFFVDMWGVTVMKSRRLYKWILLSVFLLMMSAGIERGEMAVVIDKAIRICLECIGIG